MAQSKRSSPRRDGAGSEPAGSRAGGGDAGLDQSRLERNLGFHVARAHARLRRHLLERLRECRLTLAEFSLLAIIDANQGVIQGQAAEALEIAPPNMAHLVQRMLQRHLISRARDSRDRRAWALSLTHAGRARLADAQALVEEQEARLTALFTPRERIALRELLGRIRDT